MPLDRLNNQQDILNTEDEDFPDEDFDALPLDELDAVMFQGDVAHFSQRATENPTRATMVQTELDEYSVTSSGQRLGTANSKPTDYGGRPVVGTPSTFNAADEDFMDEDMDCMIIDLQTGGTTALPDEQRHNANRESCTKKTTFSNSSCGLDSQSSTSLTSQKQFSSPSLTLSSSPFTYLCLLEQMMSRPDFQTTEICLKAFIVTLLGKLSSSNKAWNICATISDGTGYLDVELSDEVLRGLLGFSVEEKGLLKRDPSQRGQLEVGMRRCQEGLVDMCCIMTLVVEGKGRKAVVTKAEAISDTVLQELEQRLRAGRK